MSSGISGSGSSVTVLTATEAGIGGLSNCEGQVLAVNRISSQVLEYDVRSRSLRPIARTGGCPSAAVVGEAGGSGADRTGLVVADPAHGALLAVDRDGAGRGAGSGDASGAGGISVVADAYEGTSLAGPSALARCSLPSGGEMLAFCDAGASGDSGLDAPTGSVFVVVPDDGVGDGGSVLRPVCLGGLADPAAVALLAPPAAAPGAEALTGAGTRASAGALAPAGAPLAPLGFVAERGAGRVWRFCEEPAGSGAFRLSVLGHAGGGAGPSALAVDDRPGPGFGTVFVGVGEAPAACALLRAGGASEGSTGARVLALDHRGKAVGEWAVPQLSQVTGMCMDPDGAGLLVCGAAAWSGGGKAAGGDGLAGIGARPGDGLLVRIKL